MEDLAVQQMDLDLSHITSETVNVHTLPFVGPHCLALPSFRLADKASLSMADIAYGMRTVMTGTNAISGQVLEASRQEFSEALKRLIESADEEGGDGFLLGYDPLNPQARISASELGHTDECVFVWNRAPGEAPLFAWDEVAHIVTTSTSIEVYLVNGRTLFLHADIDWWNILG